jgi:hypothetical protein
VLGINDLAVAGAELDSESPFLVLATNADRTRGRVSQQVVPEAPKFVVSQPACRNLSGLTPLNTGQTPGVYMTL